MRKLGSSRRLVALACLLGTPALAADDTTEAPAVVPPMATPAIVVPADLDPAVIAAAVEEASPPDLNLTLANGVVKPTPHPNRNKASGKQTALKATQSASSNAGPIVLGKGPVALNVSTPQPSSDLSSGASFNLSLPAGAVKAEAKTSVGKDDGNWNAFWQKDSAQVKADINGPLGTALSVTGENALSLNYRTAESIGASDSTTHVVRTENRTGKINLSLPVKPLQVNLGGESTTAQTEDTSRDKSTTTSASVRTADHTVYARAAWAPISGVNMEGGAAAHVANISWQDTESKSATFESLDPHVSVTMAPWRDAQLSAKVEHVISPYDAAAFANYSRTSATSVVTGFEPDHAWQVQARLQQSVGPANVAATYTTAQQGTVTEFADIGGVQAPATTPLLNRKSVAVSVSMPLKDIGLPSTSISSEARWNSSRVVDPITQKARPASGETPQTVAVKLSHNLPAEKLSFGLSGEFKGASNAYQVSELSTTGESGSVGAFVAYKPGTYEINLNVNGLYGGSTKDEFYRGLRGSSDLSHTTTQDNSGPMLKLSLHKAF